jgi:hypothetical protein
MSPGIEIERATTRLAKPEQLKALITEECTEERGCIQFISLKSGMEVTYMCDSKVRQSLLIQQSSAADRKKEWTVHGKGQSSSNAWGEC